MTQAITGTLKGTAANEIYINDPYKKTGSITAKQFSQILDQLGDALQTLKEEAANYTDETSAATDTQQALRSNDSLWAVYSARINADNETTANTVSQRSSSLINITTEEKEYFDQIRPEQYDDEQYEASLQDYDYRLSMLDPANLPVSTSGFEFVTLPEEGISRSTDMVEPPTFTEAMGGVMRTDYTLSGEVTTYIPVTEWRKVSSSRDAAVGTVYSQQLPWGFRCFFDRGSGAPAHLGYEAGKYEDKLDAYIKQAEALVKEGITETDTEIM